MYTLEGWTVILIFRISSWKVTLIKKKTKQKNPTTQKYSAELTFPLQLIRGVFDQAEDPIGGFQGCSSVLLR